MVVTVAVFRDWLSADRYVYARPGQGLFIKPGEGDRYLVCAYVDD